MYKYPTWKYILVLLVLSYAVIYSLPNFYNTYPSIQVNTFDKKVVDNLNLQQLSEDNKISNIGIDGNNLFLIQLMIN